MHNVIIVVMITAACLAFQPQVVGRKSSDNDIRKVKMRQTRDTLLKTHHHLRDQPSKSNQSSTVKFPQYIRIYDDKSKWPSIDITSSLKPHRHSTKQHCFIARFDGILLIVHFIQLQIIFRMPCFTIKFLLINCKYKNITKFNILQIYKKLFFFVKIWVVYTYIHMSR